MNPAGAAEGKCKVLRIISNEERTIGIGYSESKNVGWDQFSLAIFLSARWLPLLKIPRFGGKGMFSLLAHSVGGTRGIKIYTIFMRSCKVKELVLILIWLMRSCVECFELGAAALGTSRTHRMMTNYTYYKKCIVCAPMFGADKHNGRGENYRNNLQRSRVLS